MAFAELDTAELTLGKPVTAMTDSELVSYLRLAIRAHQDIDLPIEGTPERSVMASLKRTYGTEAGNIVKWACYRHGAKDGDQVIGYFSFAKGRKWYCDRLYTELQQHRKEQRELASHDNQVSGFARLEDL
jgi:hypothetical protein